MNKAFFHIAGLLEKYPIISTLLDIYQNERFKFIPYVEISGVYGCNKSKWGSGRVIRNETSNPIQVCVEKERNISRYTIEQVWEKTLKQMFVMLTTENVWQDLYMV